MSAGRLYDRIGETAIGVVKYVIPQGVLCELKNDITESVNQKSRGGNVMDKGFFNGMFDFDGDGKLNFEERTMDIIAFNDLMERTERDEKAWGIRSDFDDDFDNEEFQIDICAAQQLLGMVGRFLSNIRVNVYSMCDKNNIEQE